MSQVERIKFNHSPSSTSISLYAIQASSNSFTFLALTNQRKSWLVDFRVCGVPSLINCADDVELWISILLLAYLSISLNICLRLVWTHQSINADSCAAISCRAISNYRWLIIQKLALLKPLKPPCCRLMISRVCDHEIIGIPQPAVSYFTWSM